MTMRTAMTTCLAFIAALALLALAGQLDADDSFDAERYCDMVYRHKLNPNKGWPDYDGTYDAQCVKGQLRKP